MDMTSLSDKAIIQELGTRIRRRRLRINLSQEELASRGGISRKVISELERGSSVSLSSLIRILRALNSLEELEGFLSEPAVSPIQKITMQGKTRMRATGKRTRNR